MSEENVTAAQPQGKGLGVGGFIVSLVGLLLANFMFIITAASMVTGGGKGLMYFWVVLCLGGTAMSGMGMSKLGKTGGKKGLAIAGLIIGIIASVWSIILLMGLGVAEAGAGEALMQLQNEIENM